LRELNTVDQSGIDLVAIYQKKDKPITTY